MNDFSAWEQRFAPGQVFGLYQIVGKLGMGGYGGVFEALHPDFRRVALKILRYIDDDGISQRRFQREASVLRKLDHPNIVRVFDSGILDDHSFFAMELVRGRDLADWVDAGAHHQLDFVDIFTQVATALSYCHQWGIVHRDVKAQNIVIEEASQRPILIDFGLTRFEHPALLSNSDDAFSLSASGALVGTPAYLSPEQVEPDGALGPSGPQTDVWALGITLFHCLTGEFPFPGSHAIMLFTAILSEKALRIREYNESVDPRMDELCYLCLARRPEDRPTMEEFIEQLNGTSSTKRQLSPVTAFAGFLSLSLIVFTVALSFWLSQPETLILLECSVSEPVTSRSFARLRIVTKSPGFQVKVFNKFESTTSTELSVQVPLDDGSNELVAVISNGGSGEEKRRISVYKDTVVPKIEINNEGESELYFVGANRVLKGRVVERHLLTFSIDGAPLQFLESGQFNYVVSKSAKIQKLTLTATDRAANKALRVVRVATVEAQERLEMLNERREEIARLIVAFRARNLSAEEFLSLGLQQWRMKKNMDVANAYFSLALEKNPGFVNVRAYRALCRKGIDYEGALQDIIKCIKAVPDRPFFRLIHAQILHQNEEYVEALKLFDYSVRIFKEKHGLANDREGYHSLAYFERSHCYRRLNKIDEAIRDLTTALKIDRRRYRRELIYLERCSLYEQLGDFQAALLDLQGALESVPASRMTAAKRSKYQSIAVRLKTQSATKKR
jgi:serine/threonine protein kinase/tetratricopeptide (TPR) repeat protein